MKVKTQNEIMVLAVNLLKGIRLLRNLKKHNPFLCTLEHVNVIFGFNFSSVLKYV